MDNPGRVSEAAPYAWSKHGWRKQIVGYKETWRMAPDKVATGLLLSKLTWQQTNTQNFGEAV